MFHQALPTISYTQELYELLINDRLELKLKRWNRCGDVTTHGGVAGGDVMVMNDNVDLYRCAASYCCPQLNPFLAEECMKSVNNEVNY